MPGLLDLIAAADPNPALLQVNTTDGADGDTRLTLVRLEVESVVVADSTGAEAVGVSALLQARPDPFCVMESCWLQHLEVAHRDVIDRLADRLPTRCGADASAHSGLDRYGVRLRVENDEGDHDVRLPFAKPVDDVTGLSQAIRILMGCPFLNGLAGAGARYRSSGERARGADRTRPARAAHRDRRRAGGDVRAQRLHRDPRPRSRRSCSTCPSRPLRSTRGCRRST